jgi:dihydroorotase
MDADLVLVDMESSRTISDADTWTRVGWTAYEGISLTGWPVCTVVDGTIVHSRTAGGPNSGEILVEPGSVGRALRFA